MISSYFEKLLSDKNASAIRKMFEAGRALKAKYGDENVFDFSLGNPDLEPPAEVLDAVRLVAAEQGEGSHAYMPNAGYDEAREAMAKKESLAQCVDVDASCVIMTVGAASAISSVLHTLLNEGDEVVVSAPFFAEYTHYTNSHGGVLVAVPARKDFSLDIDAIKRALNPKTAAVILNSPNNPTGRVYSREEVRALCGVLKEFAASSERAPYLISDEPYRAIVYDGVEVPPIFPEYEYSVVVTSFAKNLSLPGERIGYICVNPANPEKTRFVSAATMAFRISGCVNAPAFFQRVVARSWNAAVDYSSYKRRRDLICGILNEAGFEYTKPQGAFYVFCRVPPSWGDDDSGFVEVLERHNILCAPGAGFGMKGYFRIAYCVPEKNIVNSRSAFVKAAKCAKEN